jgi:hypothetical protein
MRRADLELVFLGDGEVQRGWLLLYIISEAERHFVVSGSSPVEYPSFGSWIFIANSFRNELVYQSLSF